MEPDKKRLKTDSVPLAPSTLCNLPMGPFLQILEATAIPHGPNISSGYIASIPQLNRLALVSREWHSVLATPYPYDCAPKLTRRVTLSQSAMFTMAEKGTIVQKWWRWVRAKQDVKDTGLSRFAVACPCVEVLDLEGCWQLTDKSLITLAARCRNLRKLNLRYCNKITDEGLASLANGCPHITDLCLGNCYRITDKGLASLTTGCPAITTLYLGQCNLTTQEALEAWKDYS